MGEPKFFEPSSYRFFLNKFTKSLVHIILAHEYFFVRSKIHTWAEQSNLYNWTAKDDRKSSLFLSNLKIHQETYVASQNKSSTCKRRSKCAEKVDQIQSVISKCK